MLVRRIRLAIATGLLGTSGGKRCLRTDLTPDRMRAIILLTLLLPIPVFADQYDRILDAIAMVETGLKPDAVGRRGEQSRFQIMPSTWVRFSRVNQPSASIAETRRVARRVLAEIETVHLKRGLRVDVYGLALGWNAGPWARKYNGATLSYAERVEALAALPQEG